jgi:hypothetical protein
VSVGQRAGAAREAPARRAAPRVIARVMARVIARVTARATAGATTRAVTALVAALAAAAAGGGGTAAGAGSRSATVGSFVSLCAFSHRAADDPIVLPGRPGASHDHTFVGNVSTDADSTLASLRANGTSCLRRADRAAYWAPTLLLSGAAVEPAGAAIYYVRQTRARVKPFPPGLRIVAGDAHAGSPQSANVTFFDCGLIKTTFYGPLVRAQGTAPVPSPIPQCPTATRLQLHVNFPDCWDGRRTDSVDHRRHMAYSRSGSCPRAHPVAVPALSLIYQYPPLAAGSVALSSGGVFSGHADFVNAWDERALTDLVARCLNARRVCETGS